MRIGDILNHNRSFKWSIIPKNAMISSPLSTAHNHLQPIPSPIIVCAIEGAIERPLGPRICITALPNARNLRQTLRFVLRKREKTWLITLNEWMFSSVHIHWVLLKHSLPRVFGQLKKYFFTSKRQVYTTGRDTLKK